MIEDATDNVDQYVVGRGLCLSLALDGGDLSVQPREAFGKASEGHKGVMMPHLLGWVDLKVVNVV